METAKKEKGAQPKKVAAKPLTSTMEDYLEAIYDLDQDKKVVRVKDIAKRLDVKMPTVTSALKTLNERGMVHYEKYEYVELTTAGSAVGHEMHRRHRLLLTFLTDILKIDHQVADEEACRMEHSLSLSTLERLADFMAFIQDCPRAGESWLEHFDIYRSSGKKPQACADCTEQFSCEEIGGQSPSGVVKPKQVIKRKAGGKGAAATGRKRSIIP